MDSEDSVRIIEQREKERRDNSRSAYDAAIKTIDREVRSIWTLFGGMVAVNAIVITLSGATFSKLLDLGDKGRAFSLALSIIGLGACWIWFLLTERTHGFYRYFSLCARQYEGLAFGEDVRMIRDGALIANGKTAIVGGESFGLTKYGNGTTAIKLIRAMIVLFAILYSCILVLASSLLIVAWK